jgi:hypothetical protein
MHSVKSSVIVQSSGKENKSKVHAEGSEAVGNISAQNKK